MRFLLSFGSDLAVLHDQDIVHHLAAAGYDDDLSILIYIEFDRCRLLVAAGRAGLYQEVVHAGLQVFHFHRACAVGCPFGHRAALAVLDPEFGAAQRPALLVDLEDPGATVRILDQQYALAVYGRCRPALVERSVFIEGEGRIRRDQVAFRGRLLMQGVGLARLQACHLMVLRRGSPFIDDHAVGIQYLQRRACQFFAGHDVRLPDTDRAFILVDELRDLAASVISHFCDQDALVKVGHRHDGFLLGSVVDIALFALHDLTDRVVIGAGLRVADGRECDVPARVVPYSVHDHAGLVIDQFEDELFVLQFPVLQSLARLEDRRSGRLIGVDEERAAAVIDGRRGQGAVAVVDHRYGDPLLGHVIGIAGLRLYRLLDGIGVGAFHLVLDRVEGDLAAVIVLPDLQLLIALVQLEAELVFPELLAELGLQLLVSFQDYRAGCLIGVDECRGLGIRADGAGITGLPGVGECRRAHFLLKDLAGLAGEGGRELSVRFFLYLIADVLCKAFRCAGFSVRQLELCHTVCEGHASVLAVDGLVIQGHHEEELSALVRCNRFFKPPHIADRMLFPHPSQLLPDRILHRHNLPVS